VVDAGSLIEAYSKVVEGVETQSCIHDGVLLTGDAWRAGGCGISYEYLNDIAVREDLQALQEARMLSDEEVRQLADWDARLKTLLVENGADPHGVRFWTSGLPRGIAP
jgi:hypothetical protein